MNEPETTTRAGPVPTLRTQYLALLTPLILTHALQSAGGLLDGFWLGRVTRRRCGAWVRRPLWLRLASGLRSPWPVRGLHPG